MKEISMSRMDDLNRMAPEKRKAELAAMRGRCACPTCPSYTLCAKDHDERMFCSYGRSPDCITRELKCMCRKCPVHEELGFRNHHYCVRGSESFKPKRF